MRFQFTRSWDFNQMLVASVFAHFMFMTLVLFIPQTVKREIVVKPALMVQLVERPTGQKKKPPKKTQRPAPKKRQAVKKPKPKPPPPPPEPKAAEPKFQPKVVTPITESLKFDPLPEASKQPDASQKIVNQLDQLEGKKPPGLIEELDQLAKLEAQKPKKKKKTAVKPVPLDKNEVREADVAQPKKLDPLEKATLPAPDPLDDFDKLKMQSDVEPPKPVPPEEKEEVEQETVSSLKELEFAALERPSLDYEKKETEKSAADLLKELNELETLRPQTSQPSPTQDPNPQASLDTSGDTGDFELILKKLDSLEVGKKEVQIDVANQKTLAMEFESDIWKVQVPEAETLPTPSVAEGGSIASEGEPDPDILAQYIGLVRQKVYKKWYEPLGRKYDNKEVVVLMTIYTKGNIDRPTISSSSGVDILDTLAVRAVMEAEPFPEFPEELKYPNLKITIHFKYVPEQ